MNTRLQVGSASPSDVAELMLFEGPLTEFQLNRIVRRDFPASLLLRQVPLVAWFEVSAGAAVAAPAAWLKAGTAYSLAAPNLGRLAEFRTAAGEPWPRLERVWPPPGAVGAGPVVFCGAGVPDAEFAVEIVPDGEMVTLAPGIGAHSWGPCVSARLNARSEDRIALFPAHVGEYLLDPEPLTVALAAGPAALVCDDTETRLGVGCIRAEDDRAVVRTPDAALLWRVEAEEGLRVLVTLAATSWVLGGLTPDSESLVRGAVFGLDGVEHVFEEVLQTASARPRVALTEVLANPQGPEPAGEWVELVNEGATAAELGGLVLSDAGGAVTLPDGRLEPGEFALLVSEAYERTPFDVPPPEACKLVRVARLAKSGLANSGEPLRLTDVAGRVLSEAPPLAGSAGVSVARFGSAVKGAAEFWANHPSPGASPCAANVKL